MKFKTVALLAFVLNTFLYGSYYSIAKEVLGRVDPIVFTFFTMITLIPPGIIILAFSWHHITREAVKSGFALGSCLCLGLFTLAVALKYNSATGTAFFPSLNGLLAAIFTWLVLRQKIGKVTWLAGIISVSGAVMLMMNAPMGGARGALIAFIGGLFCTFYVFLADREQKDPSSYWSLCGVELLTMALWANLIALLFGDWQVMNFNWPKDTWVVLYIGLGTIFLPTLITVFLQRYISPVTVSFISILEPILGALLAYLYLHEVLSLDGYLGGALVVMGVLIHTWGTIERPVVVPATGQLPQLIDTPYALYTLEQRKKSWFNVLIMPLICGCVGVLLVYRLGGFPPAAWSMLYLHWSQVSVMFQQGNSTTAILLIMQAFFWLLAWCALIVIVGVVLYRVLDKLMSEPPMTIEQDMRTLWQTGYSSPMPVASSNSYQRFSTINVQRRQQAGPDAALQGLLGQTPRHRRVRLAQINPEDDQIYEAPTHVPGRKRKI
jgi:drug/metabolite transporter (DMT)-like permease